MNTVYQELGPCPCDSEAPVCTIFGTKLTRFGHLVGCTCRACLGRRSKRKGQKGNARAHRNLGGVGPTINDDLFYAYSLNHSVEVKTGAQIPASFRRFAESEWTRHGFRQAAKKMPVGTDALPTLYIELSPSRAYLVTDVSGKELRG